MPETEGLALGLVFALDDEVLHDPDVSVGTDFACGRNADQHSSGAGVGVFAEDRTFGLSGEVVEALEGVVLLPCIRASGVPLSWHIACSS